MKKITLILSLLVVSTSVFARDLTGARLERAQARISEAIQNSNFKCEVIRGERHGEVFKLHKDFVSFATFADIEKRGSQAKLQFYETVDKDTTKVITVITSRNLSQIKHVEFRYQEGYNNVTNLDKSAAIMLGECKAVPSL